MDLARNRLDRATYNILQLMNFRPRQETRAETINKYKMAFSWLAKRKKGKNMRLLAISGEADPGVWNALEEPLMMALNKGLNYVHCLGPVVCTDNNGKNSILDTYREYPKNVKLYLFRTRAIYHWLCLTNNADDDKLRQYQLFGEYYHNPLVSALAPKYNVPLIRKNDRLLYSKMVYWHNREHVYRWQIPIMDYVDDIDKVPQLTSSQLRIAYNRMKEEGLEFNISTAKDIINFSNGS